MPEKIKKYIKWLGNSTNEKSKSKRYHHQEEEKVQLGSLAGLSAQISASLAKNTPKG
jgi:hypothetical protein